jgi:hypothetical protein
MHAVYVAFNALLASSHLLGHAEAVKMVANIRQLYGKRMLPQRLPTTQ